MEENNFLIYKGMPLVRKGKEIYYGDMANPFIVRFEILSSKKEDGRDVADNVSVQLLKSDTQLPQKERTVKETRKDTFFEALDVGFTWLERAK